MAGHSFIGTWEVIGYGYQGMPVNTGLEGVRFQLEETGDVTWTVSEELKSVPLFNCETYEIYSTSVLGVVVRFGACNGHVIEFKSDQIEPRDRVVLTCEGWCMLYCKRIKEDTVEEDYSTPFSLLPALEDGYFSDIKVKSRNNKEFKIHSSIVQLHGSEIEWQAKPPPFTGLPEEVLGTILHFLYAECLPHALDEATARHVIVAAASYQCLSKLIALCHMYLKNMELKQQTITLINDMHQCLNQVIEYFNARFATTKSENIVSNPAKLCFIVKQSVREASVAAVKLLMLSDLFTKRKNELSRQERHEIILYVKSRVPVFLSQITKFLHALKATFTSMSVTQRQEVAAYLVPEIEVIIDTISLLVFEIEKALQKILQVLSPHDPCKSKSGVSDVFGKSLRNVLHIREMTKLKLCHEHITCSLAVLLKRKENFNRMTQAQKIRCVTTDVEKLIEELPMFLMRMEEITLALDEKLEWREFKFCFKVGTSKLSGLLQKLVNHRDTLQNVMIQICELVQRSAFTEALFKLQLLDAANMPSHTEECQRAPNTSSSTPKQIHQPGYKLNLVEGLCISPTPSSSKLSKLSLQLLKSGLGTDMEFEVIVSNSAAEQTMREHTEGAQEVPQSQEDERCIIRAHRAIVAARCDWFRRALLSGMREAIDKKIVIHDTNPFLFRIFLEYLYSGRLRAQSLTTEQLAELLLLSDRYEVDHLKQCCEFALEISIDQDSVLYFLSMADQFNARHLRNACLNFISHHQELTESELFDELPIALQAEIFDCVWLKVPPRKSTTSDHLMPGSPSSPESSISDLRKAVNEMHLHSHDCPSNSSFLDELSPCQDTERLNLCLERLRDIVGDAPSREKLIQIVLAADYDLCRAVNFFYAEYQDE